MRAFSRRTSSEVRVLPACPIAVIEILLLAACGAKRQTGRLLYRTVASSREATLFHRLSLAASRIEPFAGARFAAIRMDARRTAAGHDLFGIAARLCGLQ